MKVHLQTIVSILDGSAVHVSGPESQRERERERERETERQTESDVCERHMHSVSMSLMRRLMVIIVGPFQVFNVRTGN